VCSWNFDIKRPREERPTLMYGTGGGSNDVTVPQGDRLHKTSPENTYANPLSCLKDSAQRARNRQSAEPHRPKEPVTLQMQVGSKLAGERGSADALSCSAQKQSSE